MLNRPFHMGKIVFYAWSRLLAKTNVLPISAGDYKLKLSGKFACAVRSIAPYNAVNFAYSSASRLMPCSVKFTSTCTFLPLPSASMMTP